MFTQLQYSSSSVLRASNLRQALAHSFADQQRYQLGGMDDAAECFVCSSFTYLLFYLLDVHFTSIIGSIAFLCAELLDLSKICGSSVDVKCGHPPSYSLTAPREKSTFILGQNRVCIRVGYNKLVLEG